MTRTRRNSKQGHKEFREENKDKIKIKSQHEEIVALEREIAQLKEMIKQLKGTKEDVIVPKKEKKIAPPKLTPEQEKEETRKKFAEWRKNMGKKDE